MGFIIRVAVLCLSIVLLACSIVSCVSAVFFRKDASLRVVQTIWYQELRNEIENTRLNIKASDCNAYNTAFQVMEAFCVTVAAVALFMVIFAGVNAFLPGVDARAGIIIEAFLAFVGSLGSLVCAMVTWEKGFCADDPTQLTTVPPFKSSGWSKGEAFGTICVCLALSIINLILPWFP